MTGQLETVSMSVVETVLNKTFKQAVAGITVLQENVKGTPPSPDTTAEFIRFTVNFGTSTKIANSARRDLGTQGNLFQRLGIATAQIFTPQGVGTGRAIEISELIIDAFQDAEFAGRSLTVEDITAIKVGPSGGFYQMNVDIAFQYLETK